MKLKIHSLLMVSIFVAIITVFTSSVWGTDVGGIINTDTTWDLAGSPFLINAVVQIAAGVTLTIEPGVVVNGGPLNEDIKIWGTLIASGTDVSHIIFNDVNIQTGSGSSSVVANLEFCEFNGGLPFDGSRGGTKTLILTDSNIRDTEWYIYLHGASGDVYIERNIFINSLGIDCNAQGYIRNNVFYKQQGGRAIYSGDASVVTVEHNSFLSTDRISLMVMGSGDIIGTNNYWNTTDTNIIDAMIYDKNDDLSCAGFIDYIPYLTEPHPDTPLFQIPNAAFSASPTSGVAPLQVTFTEESMGDITSWLWDFGDNETSTEENPAHTYDNAGIYIVSLTISGLGGSDTETKTDYITVNYPAPVANFTANPITGMTPLIVNFTDQSTGNITSWSWDFGDGETSTNQNSTHTYDDPGTYTVNLTVTGPGGTDKETKADYIVVENETLIANFTADKTSGFAPLTVNFSDESMGDITSWLWDFGDNETSTEENPAQTYDNTGTYTVSLTVWGPGGSDSEVKTDYITVSEPDDGGDDDDDDGGGGGGGGCFVSTSANGSRMEM